MGKTNKKKAVVIRSKIWLQDAEGNPVFGQGRLRILTAIEEHGSISAAARALHMSYLGAWRRIQATEERLGRPLLTRTMGGSTGGGSTLTPFARELLERFRRLSELTEKQVDQAYEELFPEFTGKRMPKAPSKA
ncbi:MAG: LysR family transcriptional regulator [Thermodesulfobacteriota bacterium]